MYSYRIDYRLSLPELILVIQCVTVSQLLLKCAFLAIVLIVRILYTACPQDGDQMESSLRCHHSNDAASKRHHQNDADLKMSALKRRSIEHHQLT